MIKVTSEVFVQEDHGTVIPLGNRRLRVESHWNDSGCVILSIGEERITVVAKELEAAIKNAQNTARF